MYIRFHPGFSCFNFDTQDPDGRCKARQALRSIAEGCLPIHSSGDSPMSDGMHPDVRCHLPRASLRFMSDTAMSCYWMHEPGDRCLSRWIAIFTHSAQSIMTFAIDAIERNHDGCSLLC